MNTLKNILSALLILLAGYFFVTCLVDTNRYINLERVEDFIKAVLCFSVSFSICYVYVKEVK